MSRTLEFRIGRKTVQIRQNAIDRAVSWLSPKRGSDRLRWRLAEAMAGSYTGASKKRRQTSSWLTSGGDADTDILADLPALRERSRDLVRNNPIGRGAVKTTVTNVVGTGLRLNSAIDAEFLGLTDDEATAWETRTERLWRLFADSVECDVERKLTFAAMQAMVFQQVLENGDVGVALPRFRRAPLPFLLKIQGIEADRICNRDNAADSEKLVAGVHRDQYGAATAYDVMDQHPGSMTASGRQSWTTIQARGDKTGEPNFLHIFSPERFGQTRGVPFLAPVIEPLKQLDRYTEIELMAAAVAGMFTVFIESERSGIDAGGLLAPMEPTAETGGTTADKDYRMSGGAIVELQPGEKVNAANPGRPNSAFDPFFTSIVRQIGVALELPFEILIKHYTSSYSAARAAMLDAWRFFTGRRVWLAGAFCQPVYETWLYEQVVTGRIAAPGFLADPLVRKAYCGADWTGPARGMIDETKEVQAARDRIDLTLTTHAEECAALTGGDWDRKIKRRGKEQDRKRELRLLAASPTADTVPPADEGGAEP